MRSSPEKLIDLNLSFHFFRRIFLICSFAQIVPGMAAQGQNCYDEYIVSREVLECHKKGVDTIVEFCTDINMFERDYFDEHHIVARRPWYIFWKRNGVLFIRKFVKLRGEQGPGDEFVIASDSVLLQESKPLNFIYSPDFRSDIGLQPFVYRLRRSGAEFYDRLDFNHAVYSYLAVYSDSNCMRTSFSPHWLEQYVINEKPDPVGLGNQFDTAYENLNYAYNCRSGWKRLYEIVVAEIEALESNNSFRFPPFHRKVKVTAQQRRRPVKLYKR